MKQRSIQLAVTLVLTASGLVSAQTQVDRSGALDANNQVGSGGRNTVSDRPKPWQFANDVVEGNVTGGKQFRGNVSSRDPFAFRGFTASRNSDNFIRDSSGVSTSGVTSYNANRTQQYYGDSRAAPLPNSVTTSVQQIPGSGGYIPPTPSKWRTIDPRVGAISDTPDISFRPDLYGGAGEIDTQYNPNAISVPSVIKAQQIESATLSDYTQLNRDLGSQLTPMQLQQLQSELTAKVGGSNTNTTPVVPTNGTTIINDQQITKPTDDALNDAQTPVQLNQPVGDAGIDLGSRTRLLSAAQQSSTYASLQSRVTEQEKLRPGQANENAARQFNKDFADAKADAEKKGNADQPTPKAGNSAGPAGADENIPTIAKTKEQLEAEKARAMPPLKVGSLADDRKSGLNAMLKQAETQMREGKFASAIDTYESAERVAPNNPLIKLGRANAQLGGGYYRIAEVSLRKTLMSDKALLAGQYDLRSFLGDERLQIIENDLKELIQKNDKESGAAVLQAYVYYNTGNEHRAAVLLDLADKRAQGADPLVKVLRENWNLPKSDAGDNK